MVDEIIGSVSAIFKNEYGYAIKVLVDENKMTSFYLNKNKSIDPLGFDLGFLHNQIVHIVYWTTSSGNKMVNNLKIITADNQHLPVYDGESINVYPELGGVELKANPEPPKPKQTQDSEGPKYNDHFYLKENYFLLRSILEELRKLNKQEELLWLKK